jgi:integrase/recombinase XerD
MLHTLLPKAHDRFLSLPLLGPAVDGFDDWLASNAYTRKSREAAIRMLPKIDADLRRRQVEQISDLTHSVLRDCWRALIQPYPLGAGTVRTLGRYLTAKGLMGSEQDVTASSTSPASILVGEYVSYLHGVRGFASGTVSGHRYTARCFLRHLDQARLALKDVQARHIESYIAKTGKRLSRATLQHEVARLRGFLRFLAVNDRTPAGLAAQIDTPRVYQFEQLPRSLPWETVRALLRSIDTTSAMGLRDYAMFLLIATYGLRSSEVVALTLEDVHWRQGRLRIHQRKTTSPLELPLTNEVSSAIVKHLKRTPPPSPYRRAFLRMRAPLGVLKPTAVTEAFQSLARKSGLRITFQGPHCLRHSFAVHLLKNGTPLKTIGDILGHRTPVSTSMYLRLATGDLREVPLPVPGRERSAKEAR